MNQIETRTSPMHEPVIRATAQSWTRPASLTATIGVAVAIIFLGGHFVTWMREAVAAVRFPFGLDYGEGIVWQQAVLIPGPRMYGDINVFPFIVFHYPPLYHLLARGVASLGIDQLAAGRGVSVAATLEAAVMAGLLASRSVNHRASADIRLLAALVAALALFVFRPVYQWTYVMRVDATALALSLTGIWLASLSLRRPSLIYPAMLAFVAATFTKQTAVAAPGAVLAVLFLIRPRRAIAAGLFGLAVGLAALLWVSWLTDGGFLRHIVTYNINRYSLFNAARAVWYQNNQTAFALLTLASVAGSWVWMAGGWRRPFLSEVPKRLRRDPAASELAIITLYLILLTVMLAASGKSGAAANYFIEIMTAASIWIGLGAGVALQALRTPRGGLEAPARWTAAARWVCAIGVPGLLIFQSLWVPAPRWDSNLDELTARDERLLAMVRAAPGPVLSDDMVLLMRAGKQIPLEPAIFGELGSLGLWDTGRLVDMIHARVFSLIITDAPEDSQTYRERYVPVVRDAMNKDYYVADTLSPIRIRRPLPPR